MIRGKKRTGTSSAAASAAAALYAVVLFAGCGGPTIDGVCHELDGRKCYGWTGEDACKAAGHGLHTRAEEAGCDAQFQDYLQCLDDDTGCAWEINCATERGAVEACLGAPL